MLKKAIIPVAGLGTRFLPLSKVVPKEFWPLVDKPVVQYIVEEAKASGIEEIIFVVSNKNRLVLDYFQNYFQEDRQLEERLKQKKEETVLAQLRALQELCKGISFSSVVQKEPLGDGHAIGLARKLVEGQPCAVLFADDVVESETPCLLQLAQIFKTAKQPVISLCQVTKEKLSAYGVVEVEKIAQRLYKIKRIVEKPKLEEAPSNLAIVGKYILTPEVFQELSKAKPSPQRGELILADVLEKMLKDGKIIYGYEFKGTWLECGTKLGWLQAHFKLSLKHPQFGWALRRLI